MPASFNTNTPSRYATDSSAVGISTLSPSSAPKMTERRGEGLFFLISRISSLMTAYCFALLARIALSFEMSFSSFASSSSSLPTSRRARALRRISRIACACSSLRSNLSRSVAFAFAVVSLVLMIWMTSSMLAIAMSKPLTISALAFAAFRSKVVRLTMISL